MKPKLHELVFGVFRRGKLVFPIGMPIKCSHLTASVIVGVLSLTKDVLRPGDYFACDYKERINYEK